VRVERPKEKQKKMSEAGNFKNKGRNKMKEKRRKRRNI
jgi:hypothetical protein